MLFKTRVGLTAHLWWATALRARGWQLLESVPRIDAAASAADRAVHVATSGSPGLRRQLEMGLGAWSNRVTAE